MHDAKKHVTHTILYILFLHHYTFAWHQMLRMKKSLKEWEKHLTKKKETKWESVISPGIEFSTYWSWLWHGNVTLHDGALSERGKTFHHDNVSLKTLQGSSQNHLVDNFCVMKHIHDKFVMGENFWGEHVANDNKEVHVLDW